jgi:uncharacterized membrane protein
MRPSSKPGGNRLAFTRSILQSVLARAKCQAVLSDSMIAATAGALSLSFVIRFTHGTDAPLWLDETFTGAIAAQPTLRDVVHQTLQDVNAPLYYLLAHWWSLFFGLSNGSLRFPALVFGTIAPLICLIPTQGISWRTRLLWGVVTALWIPGFHYSQEARAYSLLLCLATGGTVAFVRMLDDPNTNRVSLWSLFSGLAILTHYYVLPLVGFQALVFLWLYRERALKTWPAALLFAPAGAWLLVHLRRIAQFSDPNVVWYQPLAPIELLNVLNFTLGAPAIALAIILITCTAIIFRFIRKSEGVEREDRSQTSARTAALTGIASVAAVVALAIWRPVFTLRYLMPFVPSILLGIALVFERLQRSLRLSRLILVLSFACAAVVYNLQKDPAFKIYNFQTASNALIASGTKNLVFLWDHPNNMVEDPSQLAIVGGFFFERAGLDVHVAPVQLAAHEDPNPRLLALANQPGSAILWIYDKGVLRTAARTYPPRIGALDPAWRCHDFGLPPIGIVACSKDAKW